eukprot:492105-Rhodomonas_salina.1
MVQLLLAILLLPRRGRGLVVVVVVGVRDGGIGVGVGVVGVIDGGEGRSAVACLVCQRALRAAYGVCVDRERDKERDTVREPADSDTDSSAVACLVCQRALRAACGVCVCVSVCVTERADRERDGRE